MTAAKKTAFTARLEDPTLRLESARRYLQNAQTRAGRIAAQESINYWTKKLAAG